MSIAQSATAAMPLDSALPVQPHSAAPSIDQPQHQADLPPQRTREYSCPHLYAEILMSFPEVSGAALGEKTCVAVLHRALQELHGVVGGALPFDVLRVGKQPVAAAAATPAAAETAAEAVASSSGGSSTNILIKISKNDMDKLWPACTFMTEYGDKVCRLQLHDASGTSPGKPDNGPAREPVLVVHGRRRPRFSRGPARNHGHGRVTVARIIGAETACCWSMLEQSSRHIQVCKEFEVERHAVRTSSPGKDMRPSDTFGSSIATAVKLMLRWGL